MRNIFLFGFRGLGVRLSVLVSPTDCLSACLSWFVLFVSPGRVFISFLFTIYCVLSPCPLLHFTSLNFFLLPSSPVSMAIFLSPFLFIPLPFFPLFFPSQNHLRRRGPSSRALSDAPHPPSAAIKTDLGSSSVQSTLLRRRRFEIQMFLLIGGSRRPFSDVTVPV